MDVIEHCKISPYPSTAAAAAEKFSLSLTFFDLVLFSCPPTKYILFYSLPFHDPQFLSITLQNLKQSLSIALSHFPPLAGNLVWPENSPEPFILYNSGDSVSLTISKTHSDFNHLSSIHGRKANESDFLVPKLPLISDSVAPVMAAQITLFPNRGLSIAITTNHAVADGKTLTMFLKSWASICSNNNNNTNLPLDLSPNFDRTTVRDPNGLQALYVKYFKAFTPNTKTLSIPPNGLISDDIVTGTFELTRADIDNLRTKVSSSSSSSPSTRHLSTFVLAYSHVSICVVRSQPMEPKSKVALLFPVDWRPRGGIMNYFGNGVFGNGFCLEFGKFEEGNVMGLVSNKINDRICEIETNINEGKFVEMIEGNLRGWIKDMPISRTIVVGGSPKFGLYDVDFGWGGCDKVDMVPTSSSSTQSFTMLDSRNKNGGVEFGVVLPTHAMDIFCSLFYEGLKI